MTEKRRIGIIAHAGPLAGLVAAAAIAEALRPPQDQIDDLLRSGGPRFDLLLAGLTPAELLGVPEPDLRPSRPPKKFRHNRRG